MILPGRTIGIFGGGQLGRMTALSARKMGYRIHIFEPSANCPAGQVADKEINASYEDLEAVKSFLSDVDVVTYEFENIPAATMEFAGQFKQLFPSPRILEIFQNREREKTFLRDNGFPHAAFEVVTNADELAAAAGKLGFPCVLKTADFGYDGKGQVKIESAEADFSAIWTNFAAPKGVVEAWVDFTLELSVICAANGHNEWDTFPVAENIHTNHILDFSIVPGRFATSVADEARQLALAISRSVDLRGLLAVEMFLTREGRLVVNELAPRPHNSGHYSFDACVTSQFEQHARAVCGLPLGSTDLLRPVVMVNLLGDLWANGEPDWSRLLAADPSVKLHLYGKAVPRPGRKMGHFCVFGTTVEAAFQRATELKKQLVDAAGS